MSRKDYCAIAAALRSVTTCEPDRCSHDGHRTWNACVDAVADTLAKNNPRFDRERFYRACGSTHAAAHEAPR